MLWHLWFPFMMISERCGMEQSLLKWTVMKVSTYGNYSLNLLDTRSGRELKCAWKKLCIFLSPCVMLQKQQGIRISGPLFSETNCDHSPWLHLDTGFQGPLMLVQGIGANIVRRHLVQAGFLFTVCVSLSERPWGHWPGVPRNPTFGSFTVWKLCAKFNKYNHAYSLSLSCIGMEQERDLF